MRIVFLLNLLQDVNVSRPLIVMATRDLGLRTDILVSHKFLERDRSGSWWREIEELAETSGANVSIFESPFRALQLLEGGLGAIVAASESDLGAHAQVHEIFQLAPPSYKKITLQHGLECVGFLQNRDQEAVHGTAIRFGADIVCGWMDGSLMRSMLPSERSKLYVTGPTAVLQRPRSDRKTTQAPAGIVCENLHSVRFRSAGDFKGDFLGVFDRFCKAMQEKDKAVVLRPHPGGQYVVKNATPLRRNVRLNNNPMYKVDLTRYAYGISAPSSVLIDMVLAGIPTAVWTDEDGTMDASSYDGLTRVSTMEDWLKFAEAAETDPEPFLARQADYLRRLQMPTDPQVVAKRYAQLILATIGKQDDAWHTRRRRSERVMFFANSSTMATLQISFDRPLAAAREKGQVESQTISEIDLNRLFKFATDGLDAQKWLREQFLSFKPTVVVFCRYAGPNARLIMDLAREFGAATIMHMDDDLLNVPKTHGESKFQFHNDKKRTQTITDLLSGTDLVYCSTPRLEERFRSQGFKNEMRVGHIYCPGNVRREPVCRPARTIGYTGFREKIIEFELALPAIERFLERYPDGRLDLVGDLPCPPQLERFRERVNCREPIRDYGQFLDYLTELNWDIGICPLLPTSFNIVKANTKWVEYTSIGTAVVASCGTVYDDCCADGCGILVDGDDEWFAAFEKLASDPDARYEQVSRAQARLKADYSMERLTDQVFNMFDEAKRLAGTA